MTLLRWLAVLILAVELPVPVYWLVLHGGIGFWRRHSRGRLPYLIAVAAAWGLGGWLLYRFLRPQVFADAERPLWAILAGAALMLCDVAIFVTAESELGGRRLVGQAELSAQGELAVGGLYARVRHPRYLGMILGVLGASLVAGSERLWAVTAGWCLGTLLMIRFEERELQERFGEVYAQYARQVPMLLPRLFACGRR